jgi:hypothetical protein
MKKRHYFLRGLGVKNVPSYLNSYHLFVQKKTISSIIQETFSNV